MSLIDPSLPGCGACLRACVVCKRISQSVSHGSYAGKGRWVSNWHIKDADALIILGCTQKELNKLIRYGKIAVEKGRKTYRLSYLDVARLRQQSVLKSISIKKERADIVTAIDRLIAARQEQAEILDAWIAEWGVGYTEKPFRYGRQVDQTIPPGSLYYVYHVCHPTGRPLYVGKGVGPRMYNHEVEARKGVVSYKCNVIRKILSQGKSLCYRVVFVTPDESEAYAYEAMEIARIGRKKLTNIQAGGASLEEAGRAFQLRISSEQLNYKQFRERLVAQHAPPKKYKEYLSWWVWWRVNFLDWLYQEAIRIRHERAIHALRTEIESLEPFYTKQHSFADLEPYQRRRSEWRIERID